MANADRPPFLEARNIHKYFPGVHAVNNVNATFGVGEVVAVIGENGAGKSTLMKVLAGVHLPDSGDLLLEGEPVTIPNVAKATALGIAFIHQELNLSDNLSIGANIFLGRELRKFPPLNLIDHQAIYNRTQHILDRLSLDISPDTTVRNLSIGQQQLVEIGKALSQDARLIIMDEPTSSLTQHETDRLFELIRTLKSSGVCIVYISHRLLEIDAIADRVIVLRDGQNSGELAHDEIDHNRMVSLMVGRELTAFYQHGIHQTGKPMLEVRELVVPAVAGNDGTQHRFSGEPISFTLHAGEVVGMAGLVGAGRTELAETIFGIRRASSGWIMVNGKKTLVKTPQDAIDAGIVLVPEDRRAHGLITEFSVQYNIALAGLNRYQVGGFMKKREITSVAADMVDQLNVKTTGLNTEAGMLSGGNQQKVVLGKWISLKPQILLLDEPTRGVDVISKSEIYGLIQQMAADGVAILAISSDLEEILHISDRVLVMHEGKIAGELGREELNEEAVMMLATGKSIANLELRTED